ncbi:hypothetical protein MPDQ_006842 [Monascus purpureus]|uniref:LPXTG-motif cell wall anchor domain protein n=1 Tax=Monascus purpureus TaxID=5098 RepID=A0A507QTU8_MONPU|nr:hypothetical protein MPDQ_006842 [Monascus purpureus]
MHPMQQHDKDTTASENAVRRNRLRRKTDSALRAAAQSYRQQQQQRRRSIDLAADWRASAAIPPVPSVPSFLSLHPDQRDTMRHPQAAPSPPCSSPVTASSSLSSSSPATRPAAATTAPTLSPIAVPQAPFDFQFQLPLRKRALISHARANANITDNNNNNSESTAHEPPSLPHPHPHPHPVHPFVPPRDFLSEPFRRSVSSLHSSTVSNASSQSSSVSAAKKHRNSLPFVPNAHKRHKPSYDIESKMPAPLYQDTTAPLGASTHASGPVENGKDPTTDDAGFKSADIFLNIAKDSSRRNSVPRSEMRRSRFGFSRRSLQPSSSPDDLRVKQQETVLPYSPNGSPSYDSPISSSASAHPLDDHSRSRFWGSSARSSIGLPRSRLSHVSPDTSSEVNIERRRSVHDPHSYRHTTLSTIRSSRHPSGSDTTERPTLDFQRPHPDGTESILSTTATSTVWDELEDLKFRIRKLEQGGMSPSQAAVSNGSAERPRTATTTTMTTVSSSPRQARKASIRSGDSENATTIGQVHPLLQTALDKAKGVLNSEVYKALETAAAEATSLSSILGGGTALSGGASVVSGFAPSERHARRKADSLCRSLTELCLALSDERLTGQRAESCEANSNPQQTNGTKTEPPVAPITYRRSLNCNEIEAVDRQLQTIRISGRPQAHRKSFTSSSSPLANPDANTTPSPNAPAPVPNRPHRLSPSLLRPRLLLRTEDNSDKREFSRSVSRVPAEISTPATLRRISSREDISRDSTQDNSQQQQPRTPALSSSIPLRRSAYYTPPASSVNIQPGFRRYGFQSGLTPSSADTLKDNGIDGAALSQQEPSRTRIIAPSTKLATSITPIQLTRARTNSLGTRRFTPRSPRPVTICGEIKTTADSLD